MSHHLRTALTTGALHLLALAFLSPLVAQDLSLLGQAVPTAGDGGSESEGASAPAEPATYVVKPGDNLSRIALDLLGDASRWSEIYQANRSILKNPNRIAVGMTLRVSAGATARARTAAVVEAVTSDGSRGSFNVVKPLASGRITSGFGMRVNPVTRRRQMHGGMDIAVPRGTPIRVTGAGTVIASGWAGGYGRVVKVRHGDGTVTVYAHCRSLEVKRGARVEAGQVIATVNSTGRSTGNHLHFEVQRGGRAVDPRPFFGFRSGKVPA